MRPMFAAVCLGMLVPGGPAATGAVTGEMEPRSAEVIWQWDGRLPDDTMVTASLRLYHEAGNFTFTAVGYRGNCKVDVAVRVVADQTWRLYQPCETGTTFGDVVIEGTYSVSRWHREGSSIRFDFAFSGLVWDELIGGLRGATLGRIGYTWQVSGTFAAPTPSPVAERTFQIVAQHSGKCVDVSGASAESGAPVHQWDCMGSQQRNQVWLLRPARDGLYMVIAQHSSKCLDVEGQSQANGAPVIQWECHFMQGNQLWAVRDLGGGRVQLVASHSGKCLTLSGPSAENGGRLLQWDCDPSNQPGQPFALRAVQ